MRKFIVGKDGHPYPKSELLRKYWGKEIQVSDFSNEPDGEWAHIYDENSGQTMHFHIDRMLTEIY